jgi:hypothetical protein
MHACMHDTTSFPSRKLNRFSLWTCTCTRLELARTRHDIRLSGRSARRDDIGAGADCEDRHTIRIEPHQRAATIGTQWRGARPLWSQLY